MNLPRAKVEVTSTRDRPARAGSRQKLLKTAWGGFAPTLHYIFYPGSVIISRIVSIFNIL